MDSPLAADFRRFRHDPSDVVDGALLIARMIDPAAETAWATDELARLGAELGASQTAEQLVLGLRERGFAGAADAFNSVESSALDKVLRNKRGLPISMAVVLIAVAEQIGLDAHGINFPGHFLARVADVLVDPFALECTTEATCRQWLRQNNVPPDDAFRVAEPADIVLRMLNNLRMMAVGRQDYVQALEITDYQVIMMPNAFGLHLDRAELWAALGSADMTRHELERALELAPNEKTRARVEDRLRALGQVDGTVN